MAFRCAPWATDEAKRRGGSGGSALQGRGRGVVVVHGTKREEEMGGWRLAAKEVHSFVLADHIGGRYRPGHEEEEEDEIKEA